MQSNFALTITPSVLEVSPLSGSSIGIATESLNVMSPVAWPSTPSLALNSTNLVAPSSRTNFTEPVAEDPSARCACTRFGTATHTANNASTKAPIMLFIERSPREWNKFLGRSVYEDFDNQSQIAPHDTNEQRSALHPNAYFYPHSGHTFCRRVFHADFRHTATAGRENHRQSCGRYSRPTQSSSGISRHSEQ